MEKKQAIMVPRASFWGLSDKWTVQQLIDWFFTVYSDALGNRKRNARIIRQGKVLGQWDKLEDGETVIVDNS